MGKHEKLSPRWWSAQEREAVHVIDGGRAELSRAMAERGDWPERAP